MSGVAACGGAERGYDHCTGASRSVPSNLIVSLIYSPVNKPLSLYIITCINHRDSYDGCLVGTDSW